MANITNRHTSPIALPGGTVIPAGKTVSVDNWPSLSRSKLIQTWLRAGVLSERDKAGAGDIEAAAKKPKELTAQAVLDMATDGTSFQAFKAAAATILGDNMPGRKADIVEALKEKV